jgi:hypothetical protein
MKTKFILFTPLIFAIVLACESPSKLGNLENEKEINPAAQGFNITESDAQAIAIADEVMEAMGGRSAWDETTFFTWNFFGVRKHWWNKSTGDIRIEVPNANLTILMNLDTEEGKAKKGETIYTKEDSLDFYLSRAKQWWVNDGYWLFMPFKLKDSGVTLKYLREDTLQNGASADVLQLTFQEVGFTPNNKYWVYVDKETKLVSQWAFFANYDQEEPNFNIPWQDYKDYGKLLLAGNRGEREVSEINVLNDVSSSLFSEF